MRYVIIGGGIAGISAAKAIRDHDQDASIVVYSNELHPLGLYARKDMLRRFAAGVYEQDDLLLQSKETLEEQGIQFVYQDIPRLDRAQRAVFKSYDIHHEYDRLLLATGAAPQLVDAPGLHLVGVHQVRNFEDIAVLQAWLPELKSKGVVVVGGGILALDLAYALSRHAVPTTLVVRESQLGSPLLGESASKLLEARARADGITIHFGRTLSAYLSEGDRVLNAVALDDGAVLPARAAICAIGVRSNNALAADAGLAVDAVSGGIIVNEFMRTTDEYIYAAGNCALVNGEIARNWILSAEQGRVAGLAMVGYQIPYEPTVPGDLNSRIFDLPLAYFGSTQPRTPAAHLWSWDNGVDRAVQVVVERSRIAGVSVLGSLPGVVEHLLAQYAAQTTITLDELRELAFA
jgi:nitrite reductase (NADH) large subunit